MDSYNELFLQILNDYLKKENEIFEKAIRENANPPLKGAITPGKLKWRGISIAFNTGTGERWVMQRMVQISQKVKMAPLFHTVLG